MVATEEKCRRGATKKKKKKIRIALKLMTLPDSNEVCFRPHTVRNFEWVELVTK